MKLATLDFETDPFLAGRLPLAFDAGFYDGETHKEIWHPDCANLMLDYIETLEEPHIIFAHNGGKFDFFFFMKRILDPNAPVQMKIVNGRILEFKIGIHTFRDSYAIIPLPLRTFEKDDIDYEKLEKEVRETHKEEIQKYRRQDCKGLYDVVARFRERFGDALTIGSAAQTELKKFHPYKPVKDQFDSKFRPYFYGGRVQCFEGGDIQAKGVMVDVNSMYPSCMRNARHPISSAHSVGSRITPNTMFARVIARNYGALPFRDDDTGNLTFDKPYGEFFATIHEIEAGIETGTCEIIKVLASYDFEETTSFKDFVDYWYGLRVAAQKAMYVPGTKVIADIIAYIDYQLIKLILNSAYGKFAMDSRDFCDAIILSIDGDIPMPLCQCQADRCECKTFNLCEDESGVPSYGWRLAHGCMDYNIWEKRIDRPYFLNVATAASITGAARATLLRGLASADRPFYCDTDSIFCERFRGDVDEFRLGAWKHEGTFDRIAIGGKKMYAVFKDGERVKQASKGGKLTAEEIVSVSRGTIVHTVNQAPAFKLDGNHVFVSRGIKATLPKEYGKVGKIELESV